MNAAAALLLAALFSLKHRVSTQGAAYTENQSVKVFIYSAAFPPFEVFSNLEHQSFLRQFSLTGIK